MDGLADNETLARAQRKLERDMGPLVLAALHDPRTVGIMLNADGLRHLNILVSGVTGSGKTTLINAIIYEMARCYG